MFSSCPSLTAIIAQSTSPLTLSTNTYVGSNTILYVPNTTAETAYEAATNYSTVFGTNKIRPILELVGDTQVNVNVGSTYTEQGATVAGFNTANASEYTQYGYTLSAPTIKKNGATVASVDTSAAGTYEITYNLTYTNPNVAGATAQNVMAVTRTVIVIEANYSVDGVYYPTLATAYASITGTAGTIKVEKSNTDNTVVTIASGKNITLDLNGKTIIVDEINSGAFITNKGTLTIKDELGSGKIKVLNSHTGSYSGKGSTYIVNNESSFILNSGLLELESNIQSPAVIFNSKSEATTTVNGGKILASNNSEIGCTDLVGISAAGGSVTINSGEIIVDEDLGIIGRYCIDAKTDEKVDIIVNGGYMYSPNVCIIMRNVTSSAMNESTLTVTGNPELVSIGRTIDNVCSIKDIYIKGGTIKNIGSEELIGPYFNVSAIYNQSSKTIIGTNEATPVVSRTSPMIQSVGYGIESINGVEFYDGIIKGVNKPIEPDSSQNIPITAVPSGYEVVNDVETINSVTYNTAYLKRINPISVTSPQSWDSRFSFNDQTKEITGATNAQGTVTYTLKNIRNTDGGYYPISYFSLNGTTLTQTGRTPIGYYIVTIEATASGNDEYNSGTKEIIVNVTIDKAINPLNGTETQSWINTYNTVVQSYSMTIPDAVGYVTYTLNSQKDSNGTAVSYYTLDGTKVKQAASTPAGSYEVEIIASSNGTNNDSAGYYEAGSKSIIVEVTVEKADNPMIVSANQTWNSKYNADSQSKTLSVSKAQGAVTYTLESQFMGDSPVTYFSMDGASLIQAGLTPIGTYTVTITANAAGNNNYKPGSKTITMTVIVGKGNNPIEIIYNQYWNNTYSPSEQTTSITQATNAAGAVTYTINTQKDSSGVVVTYFSLSGTTLTQAGSTPLGTYNVTIRVSAAGDDKYQSGSVTTKMTVTVGNAPITGNVKITGINTYGQTLTADTSNIEPTGCTLTYQWYASDTNSAEGGSPIADATGSTYTVGSGLAGKYIYVVVTASKTNYTTTTFTDITDATNNGTAQVAKAEVTIPTVTDTTKTFNGTAANISGSEQHPAISGYDSTLMTQTGTTAATNVGNYTITYSLKDTDNYMWSDSTITDKSFGWVIQKAPGFVTLSSTTGSVKFGTASTTFNIATNHGGTLSASDDNSTATASISGSTVTIGNIASLSACTDVVITVTCASTSNYDAATATYKLTIEGDTQINVESVANQTYTGSEIKPEPIVKSMSGTTLTKGTDYTLSYTNNINVGTDTAIITVTGIGNYDGASKNVTFTITKKPITITTGSATKVYDGTPLTCGTATITTGSLAAGHILGGIPTSSITDVGTTPNTLSVETVTIIDGSSNSVKGNYDITIICGTLEVTEKPLTYQAAGINKVYDGTKAGKINITNVDGIVTGDNVIVPTSVDGIFVDKNVGNGKTITPNNNVITLTGTKAGNYTIANLSTYSANITKKEITYTATVANKNYDGTTVATINITNVAGIITGDNVTVATSVEGTFANVGPNSNIAVTMNSAPTLSGTDAGNYSISIVTGLSAKITSNAIEYTATGYTGDYDGNPHGIDISVTAPATGYTIKYGTQADTYNLDTCPTYTNAGTYTIYYEITADGYDTVTGSATIVINKASASLTVDTDNISLKAGESGEISYTYTGDGTLSVDSADDGKATGEISGTKVVITAGDTIGTVNITISAEEGTNYNATSVTITVTVSDKEISILTQPVSITHTPNYNVVYNVVASGSNIVYKWQYRENSSATWKDCTDAQGSGYNTATFTTIPTTMEMKGYQYRCILTNSYGTVTSDIASYNIPIMKARVNNFYMFGWNDSEHDVKLVKSVTITTSNIVPENAVDSIDVSLNNDGSVMTWIVPNAEDNTKYDQYIGGNGGVVASSCKGLFSNYSECILINNLNNLDTSMVTDFSSMFSGCVKLLSADVSHFDTSNGTNFSSMFRYCQSLNTIDVSGFDTGNATNMSSMFYYCEAVQELDVSHFVTTNVTNMSEMFRNCKMVTTLDVDSFNTSNVKYFYGMFEDCNALTTLDVSGFNTTCGESMSSMFEGCKKLEVIDVSHFDTQNVINMKNMFAQCFEVEKLEVDQFNTTKVQDMSGMFFECRSLSDLNVSNFKTSNVTDMHCMFEECYELPEINVSGFDTSNVTTLERMFSNCRLIKTIDVSNFDTSKVENLFGMFEQCFALEEIDLTNFDTSKVTDMVYMFRDCKTLTSLNLSSFSTASVENMMEMCYGCTALKTILLGKDFNRIVDTYPNIFGGNPALRAIIITKPATTSSEAMKLEIELNDGALSVNDNVVLYVPNAESEASYEAIPEYVASFGVNRIRPILELLGPSEIELMIGNTFIEQGVTVAGFTTANATEYTQYGYTLNGPIFKKDGETVDSVDTFSEGTYQVIYNLTYKNLADGDSAIAEDVMSVTRTVKIIANSTIEGVKLNNGASTTKNLYVIVDIEASNAEYMYISNSSTLPTSPSWVPYKQYSKHRLVPGNGNKNVYVWVKGANGVASECMSATIKLDTTYDLKVINKQAYMGTKNFTVYYAIKKGDGSWTDWQTSDTFEGLEAGTIYYAKTKIVDELGYSEESEVLKFEAVYNASGVFEIQKK